MIEQYRQLYQKMLVEMEECGQRYATEKEQIECCFQTCERNWNALLKLLDHRQFRTLDEEIWFFKTVKPAFTGMLEYFALVYKAALFRPETGSDVHEVRIFWQKELRHAEKFLEENEQFYQYYKTGSTEMDKVYFVRAAKNDPAHPPAFRSHTATDPFKASSSHDGLFAAIQARDKYLGYVRSKIETVGTQPL
jgi:hypothetical protein